MGMPSTERSRYPTDVGRVGDLNNGSFIATSRHDTPLEAFVGDGLAIENVETELGYPEMVVWRLGFDEPG